MGINSHQLSLASGDTCLEDWNIDTSACDYESLLTELRNELPETCGHDASAELQLALNVESETDAKIKISEICSKDYFPWKEVSQKGHVFDNEIFDGGTYYNEARESVDEYGIYQDRLADEPGVRIREIQKVVAKNRGMEFPTYLEHFENCDLRAVMCCFVQDRQANDGNGNCATPYEENCIDADPADNTDICYHDMRNSPISSRTRGGFSLFEGEDEGDAHCHGFAWSSDPSDQSARYLGNNLFYVTLYDHLTKRGYVGNVPGAPKCACVEQMPVVTRADCTEIDASENVQFSYSGGVLDATISNADINFNACQGANDNNNDLEAYYERLKNEGKATDTELAGVRKHLVGETYCREAIDGFLKDKGLQKPLACRDGDEEKCGCDNVKQSDYRGTISNTISGKTCQRWDSQEPHRHGRTRKNYPEKGLTENNCRNPDGEDEGAWCYTTDPDTRWEYCDVPVCEEEEYEGACEMSDPETCGCDEVQQSDYRGTISKTKSGIECQRWDSKEPHGHSRVINNYPKSDLIENYCRNPDGEDGAWCYTTDPNKRWEYCDVPVCSATTSTRKLRGFI